VRPPLVPVAENRGAALVAELSGRGFGMPGLRT
jgi:hypothetical protein